MKLFESIKAFWSEVTGNDVSEYSEAEMADAIRANGKSILNAINSYKSQSNEISELKEVNANMNTFKVGVDAKLTELSERLNMYNDNITSMAATISELSEKTQELAKSQADILGLEKPSGEANASKTIEQLENNVVGQVVANGANYDSKSIADDVNSKK